MKERSPTTGRHSCLAHCAPWCSLLTAAGCDKRVPGRGLLGGAGLDQGGGGGGGGGGLAAAGPHLTCGW